MWRWLLHSSAMNSCKIQNDLLDDKIGIAISFDVKIHRHGLKSKFISVNMASYYLFMLVLPALILVCPNCVSSLIYCQAGAYEFPLKNDRPVCLLCPEGTFMPHHDHRFTQCFKCTEIVDPSLEILISPCNDTQDAVIHCIPGYYRRLGRNPREKARCEKCTECDHPIVPCQTYEDTHCCPGDHFIVYPETSGVPVCWETYWLCRRGHYFDNDSYLCEPCHTGTFMSIDYHSMTECWPCQTPSKRHHLPKHATIIQQCNSTHPPIIACEDGFYTDHDLDYQVHSIGCSPCTVCNSTDRKYEGRACGRFQDTICCPQPDMIVVDSPEGIMRCETDTKSLLGTETVSDYHQMIEASTTSGISASITTKGTPATPNGSCGECRSESLSYHSVIGVTVIVTVFAVLFLVTMVVFLFRRQWLSKITKLLFNLPLCAEQYEDEHELGEAVPLLLITRDNLETISNESLQEKIQIEAHVKDFRLSESDYKRVMELLDEEMNKGLKLESHQQADVKMFPTFVRSLPDRSESGEFLAMEWGSMRIRFLYIRLEGGDIEEMIWKKTDIIPQEIKSGNKSQLFDFIAGCIEDFISQLNMTDRELLLGWNVSFPCCHTSLERATLTRMTKEFHCTNVVGEEISQLLDEKLKRRGKCKVKTVAIVNDTVSAMTSMAHGDPDCHVGMVMARGFNVCYMEEIENVEMMNVDDMDTLQPGQVIINTELGALGDNGCLDFIPTEYDREVDANTDFPGQQRLEKMISGTYLGEIVRLVLVKLIQNGLLFKELHDDHLLLTEGSLSFKYVLDIESDPEGELQSTKRVLDDMKIEDYIVKDEDCKIVRYVCSLVSERAAFLAAAALATVINRMNKSDVTVAVDGSLYKLHARIQTLMQKKTTKLVKPHIQFKLHEADGGSAVGAALAAAVAVRLSNVVSK